LVKKEQERYNFKIVDVNRMRFCSLSIQQRAQNLSKLTEEITDLKIIAQAYKQHLSMEQNFYNLLLSFVKINHKKKHYKKFLKNLFRNT